MCVCWCRQLQCGFSSVKTTLDWLIPKSVGSFYFDIKLINEWKPLIYSITSDLSVLILNNSLETKVFKQFKHTTSSIIFLITLWFKPKVQQVIFIVINSSSFLQNGFKPHFPKLNFQCTTLRNRKVYGTKPISSFCISPKMYHIIKVIIRSLK